MYILPWVLSLVAVTSAAPTNFFDDAYDFSEELLGYYSKVSETINQIGHNSESSAVQCDTSKISLPSYASGLPSPTGLTPMYVGLGRGTQVCAFSNTISPPSG